jgi:O-antigen/teichoic acid export membrane protein
MAEAMGRRMASGAVLGAMNIAMAALVTLVATPLYLGALHDSSFGLNGVFQSVFAVFNLLSLGAMEATLYFAAKEKSKAYVAVLLRWHLAAASLGALLLILGKMLGLGSWMGLQGAELDQFQQALLPAAVLWAFQFFCQWLWTLCKARLRFKLQAWHQLLQSVLVPVFALAGLSYFGGLDAFLWFQALAWFLSCLALLPLLLGPGEWRGGLDREALREVAAYSRWTLLFSLGLVALQSMDRFLVVPLGAATVAAYAIASSFFQRGVSALGLLPGLLQPAVSRMDEGQGRERAARAYGLSLRLCAILALAFFLPLAALGKSFLAAWLDSKSPGMSSRAYPSLVLFSAAGVVASMSAVVHGVLLGLGRPRLVGLTALGGAAIGLVSAWIGVKAWGLEGAVLAVLVGYGVMYLVRMLVTELRIFKRSLGRLAAEHALLAFAALAAFWCLSLGQGFLEGRGLFWQFLGLALAAFSLLGLGLAADAWLAARLKRSSLVGTFRAILTHAA